MDHEIESAEVSNNLAEKQKDIDDCIRRAVNIGRINLVFSSKYNNLRIFKGNLNENIYLAEISTRAQVGVHSLDRGDNPLELIVETGSVDLESIEKVLPAFFREHYPDAQNLPIYVYSSKDDFIAKKTAIKIDIDA